MYTHRDGKWCAFYGEESTEIRRRFFEHTLKLIDNGWDKEPPVRLAIYDAGAEPVALLGEQAWPPQDLVSRTLALDSAQNTITEGLPVPAAAFTSFKTRRGSARFTWIIPEDMDVIGPMALRLHVELRGVQDIFLFAGVRKFRDGAELKFEGSFGFSGDMVSKGWQRAAHRELDAFSTPSQPLHTHRLAEPLHPGEIVPVDIALQPHATRFRRADVLCVDVQGRWFFPRNPFFGQFPSTYQRSMEGLRQATTLLEILKSPDAHRPKLLKFIQRRTALIKRADFPKPPWMRMMENADKFREYELARRNGTWKPPVPVTPAVAPPSASSTAKCKSVWRAPVPTPLHVNTEPFPHSPAWEERLWSFLGEWFSRDVPIDLRIPLMDRVSHLLKFDGHLPYRYVQVKFTTFAAVFDACAPYPEDTALAWHAAWALRFLFALKRKPECMNTDLREATARALIAEEIHNG